jgi:1-acyl-sn-glycerol-3-phosphate acyltransferase
MTVWGHCKSAASLSVITINLTLWCVPLLLLGLLKLVVPGVRGTVDEAMDWIYRIAVRIDDFWLKRVIGIDWDRPAIELARDRTCIIVSNHVCWADILLIQSVIARDGPILKFLAKRELVAIPIFGLIIWAYDFPALRRKTKHGGDEAARRRLDLEALHEACRVVRRRPAALMNFAEGTRIDEAKRLAQESPHRHLLRPRVGGLATLLEGLEGAGDVVVDLTLVYPEGTTFWMFLSGAVQRVVIEAETFPIASLPRDRESVSSWLAARWAAKDERIDQLRRG